MKKFDIMFPDIACLTKQYLSTYCRLAVQVFFFWSIRDSGARWKVDSARLIFGHYRRTNGYVPENNDDNKLTS